MFEARDIVVREMGQLAGSVELTPQDRSAVGGGVAAQVPEVGLSFQRDVAFCPGCLGCVGATAEQGSRDERRQDAGASLDLRRSHDGGCPPDFLRHANAITPFILSIDVIREIGESRIPTNGKYGALR